MLLGQKQQKAPKTNGGKADDQELKRFHLDGWRVSQPFHLSENGYCSFRAELLGEDAIKLWVKPSKYVAFWVWSQSPYSFVVSKGCHGVFTRVPVEALVDPQPSLLSFSWWRWRRLFDFWGFTQSSLRGEEIENQSTQQKPPSTPLGQHSGL